MGSRALMHRICTRVFLVGVALAALAACEPAPPPPAPATATPLPTPTALPTATPQPEPTPQPLGSGPLGASGARLVDALGREVRLTGVNWSGMETSTFAPNGLASRPADEMLDQIVSAGFNTIRLPYSNQLFDAGSRPNGV